MRRAWTAADRAILRDRVASGVSFAEVGCELGRSAGCARVAHLRAFGSRNTIREWTARERGQLQRSYADGVPLSEIATQLKRTTRAIAMAAVRFKLPTHPKAKRRPSPQAQDQS